MREEKTAVLIFSLQRYHYVAFKLPVVWDCNRAGVKKHLPKDSEYEYFLTVFVAVNLKVEKLFP